MEIIKLTFLQKRFASLYEVFVQRAQTYPEISVLTAEHELIPIDAEIFYTLKSFFIKPKFDGKIEFSVDNADRDLFKETGVNLSAEAVGLAISWNVYQSIISECKNSSDEVHEHVFRYLLTQLNKYIKAHDEERIIGLAYQLMEFPDIDKPSKLFLVKN